MFFILIFVCVVFFRDGEFNKDYDRKMSVKVSHQTFFFFGFVISMVTCILCTFFISNKYSFSSLFWKHFSYSQSMVSFLQDPTGDAPWEEDPSANDVIHISSDNVSAWANTNRIMC